MQYEWAPGPWRERRDLFLPGRRAGCSETPSKTGHAVHISKPQSQINVLFKEPKQLFTAAATAAAAFPRLFPLPARVQVARV